MQCNIGKTDRIIRITAGLIIISAGIYFQNLWGLVGLVPLVTGAIKWCPAYVPLKINTN
jgi:hypothetical protein